jgi:hypothetical protein
VFYGRDYIKDKIKSFKMRINEENILEIIQVKVMTI